MTPKEALNRAYILLSPYSDHQKWEFESNLFHLNFVLQRLSPHDRIVDIGCGIGILALALKLLGYDVDGIDKYVFEAANTYTVTDVDHLKKIWREQNISIHAGDTINKTLHETYDVVISIAVIEHQPNLRAFMDGLMNQLKPGGHLYIATPNGVNFLNRFRVLYGRAPMGNIKEFFTATPVFTGHWREYTVDELRIIAKFTGLNNIKVGNRQTVKPRWTKNWRKWHINLARLGGYLIRNAGDTNYIWAQK